MGSISLAISTGSAQYALRAAQTPAHDWTLDLLLTVAISALAVVLGGWLTLWAGISGVYLAASALGHQSQRLEKLIADRGPAVIRRLIAAGVGMGLTLTAAPALAATEDRSDPATNGASHPMSITALAWQNSVTTGTQKDAAQSDGPMRVRSGPADHQDHIVTVRPGDSLWGVAAQHLGAGATDQEIAAAWPAWFDLNRDAIGSNPGLITPGQQLLNPFSSK